MHTAGAFPLYLLYGFLHETASFVSDQVDLLRARGLIIPDQQKAEHYLSNISYYRLSAYTRPFQVNKVTHTFDVGANFDQVLQVYVFDRALRVHLFDAIERIEVAIRAKIIQQMAVQHGPHWHQIRTLFRANPYGKSDAYDLLEKEIVRVCNGKRKDVFIQHYLDTYDNPVYPPSWMCFEALTLGTLSQIFQALAENADRKAIADHFRLPPLVLESWLHSLSYVRNLCAHHCRVWNRELGVAPLYLKAKNIGPWIGRPFPPNDRIYYVLCCVRYLLQAINPRGSFTNRTKELLARYAGVPLTNMGFQAEWESAPLWAD